MAKEIVVSELSNRLRIDRDDLDSEMILQPEIFYQVSYAHADAVSVRDSLKVDIEHTEAELYLQYRQKAEDKEEKMTDTAIKRWVETSVKMKQLNKSFLAAKTKADKLYALKEAYEIRGKMLQQLTTLYSANYWSSESGGKRVSDIKKDRADRNREEAGRLRRAKRGEDDD